MRRRQFIVRKVFFLKNTRFFYFLPFIFCYLFCFTFKAFAFQELDDYQFQNEKYRQLYQEFIAARDKYLTYKTLESKEEAKTKLKEIIVQRSEVLRTYFSALKHLLVETPGVITGKRSVFRENLDAKIYWLDNHKKSVESLESPTFDDLFEQANHFERQEAEFKRLPFVVLSTIFIARSRALYSESTSLTVTLEGKTADFNQWLEVVKNQNYFSLQKIEEAEAGLSQLENSRKVEEFAKIFSKIQGNLEESRNFLLQALKYQKEILKASQK